MGIGAEVSFGPCVCGHAPGPPSRDRYPWAVLAGHDGSVSLAGPDGAPLATCPAAGEAIRAAVAFPFVGRVGEPFWTTVDPPLAARDGYDEHPGVLAGFRLVRLRLDALLPEARPRGALADATVLEVLDPMALLALPPAVGEIGPVALPGIRPTLAACCPLRRIDAAFEGDVGGWILVHVGDRGAALLAYGQWGAHEDEVVAGHRPLGPAEAARFGLDPGPPAGGPSLPRAGARGTPFGATAAARSRRGSATA